MIGARRDPPPSRSANAFGRRRPLAAAEWEQANRLGMLLLHALIGLMAGLLILFNGTAATFDQYGDWMRLTTGGLAFVGGAVLVAGLAWRSTSILLEMVGLTILALWTLTMAGGFVLASLSAGVLIIEWPWHAFSDMPAERLYPIVLYLGLFLMTSLHLWTASRLRLLALAARHRAAGSQRLLEPTAGMARPGQQRVSAAPGSASSMAKQPSIEGLAGRRPLDRDAAAEGPAVDLLSRSRSSGPRRP
ncbi:hypothetical protein NPS01_40690 [Nocardioides psychrotolerans]|uniref:Uncharacterized protein n=1 Tax=Nocardioides psychrotolerans TaxID=1005945 RepID=A0A1I3GQD2_9ACTN|nr:hypothetical protein [Nocardioides psychrotolerans]GEP40406.1 hypothetical protein NPS01_40690 [Nocardioides psychrotolerans]SFI25551.1 hypothetical protein SAMN05216561_106226 [Nocardioides psychrotolerans]